MKQQEHQNIWKIRTIKNYREAHNHILIGRVLEYTRAFVKLKCKTYHFGRSVNSPKEIRVGNEGIRIVPWNRIEIVNQLDQSFDYSTAELNVDRAGSVLLSDGKIECVITTSYDSRY